MKVPQNKCGKRRSGSSGHLISEFFVGVKKFLNTHNAMKMHILTRKNLKCYLLLGISVFMQPNALVQQSM